MADLIDELAYRFWSIHPKDIPEPVGMPEGYKGGARAWFYANEMRRIVSLPAQGVRVKPLVWKPMRLAGLHAFCPLLNVTYYADDADDAARQDATRAAAILAALSPAEAGGVEARGVLSDEQRAALNAEPAGTITTAPTPDAVEAAQAQAREAWRIAGMVTNNGEALLVHKAICDLFRLPFDPKAAPAPDAHRAQPRKEVMPSEQADDPVNSRHDTSPGVTAGAELETCGKCMGSGYGGHPDSGALCPECDGSGGVAPAPVDKQLAANVDALVKAAERVLTADVDSMEGHSAVSDLKAALAAIREGRG